MTINYNLSQITPMNSDLLLYIIAIIALVSGFHIIKKVTSCLVKTIVLLVIVAALAFFYVSTT